MAKTINQQLADAIVDVIKDIKRVTESRDTANFIGKTATEIVVDRTRDGKSIDRNKGKTQPMKELQPQTVDIRRNLRKNGKLSPKTSPPKSNMTRSGSLMDNLHHTIKTDEIVIKSKRNDTRKLKDNIRLGRKVMGLAADEINEVCDELSELIIKKIKR